MTPSRLLGPGVVEVDVVGHVTSGTLDGHLVTDVTIGLVAGLLVAAAFVGLLQLRRTRSASVRVGRDTDVDGTRRSHDAHDTHDAQNANAHDAPDTRNSG